MQVSYAGSVSREIDQSYSAWKAGKGPPTRLVDLTDRIVRPARVEPAILLVPRAPAAC
jgi:hypothetical protein